MARSTLSAQNAPSLAGAGGLPTGLQELMLSVAGSDESLSELVPWNENGNYETHEASLDTKDVTIVGWIDKNAVQFPDESQVSYLLRTSLGAKGIVCGAVVAGFAAGDRSLIFTDIDRQFANAFLIGNSGNNAPPDKIDPVAYLKAGDFRSFNRIKATIRTSGNEVSSPTYITSLAQAGYTIDSCASFFTPRALLAPEVHPDNGRKGVTSSKLNLYQLNEGRVGTVGQRANMTLNACTSVSLSGKCNAPYSPTVPWIFSLVKFDAKGNYTLQEQIFPTYSVYEDGKLVNTIRQHALEDFIRLNSSSQIKAGDIQ